MTIMGKVAIPKPVNLPSQRWENHGLDPNVEIVPKKSTLSWGNGPPSQPNAWGSSSQSPHANGTAGSSGQLGGRHSSGRMVLDYLQPVVIDLMNPLLMQGFNSRPLSASGILASNQKSMSSSRPCSAETRPGSSQLSRFAESINENSGPWGGLTTTKKLGISSSRSGEFILSSEDFPTLGSEKSSEMLSREGHSSHGRPGSAFSATSNQKESASSPNEDGRVDVIDMKVSVNTGRRDASPYNERGGLHQASRSGRGILKWHIYVLTQKFNHIILTHGMELQFEILLMVYGIEVDLQVVHMDLGGAATLLWILWSSTYEFL